MTYSKEAEFQDDFVKELRRYGAYAASNVGSMFSSGKPDLLIVSQVGSVRLVELKMWRRVTVPTHENLLSLLDGPQVNVITQQLWAKRKNNCLLLALLSALPAQDKCVYTDYTGKICVDFWKNVAMMLARGTLRE